MSVPYSVFLDGNDFKNRLGFHRILDRRFVMGAKNVFTLSRYMARGGRELGIPEDRIVVLPPGMENRWEENKKVQLPEAVRNSARGKIVLFGLGPFIPRKGLDLAIEAVSRLENKDRFHLFISGSGPEYSYYEELIRIHDLKSHVTLTGFLPDHLLPAMFGVSDIFVQPGCEREDDVEGLGTALLEASWAGLPTIAGRVGGVEEIVRQGVTGFIIEPGSVDELVKRICELAESAPLRKRLGQNAREIAEKEYDMTRTCAAIDVRL